MDFNSIPVQVQIQLVREPGNLYNTGLHRIILQAFIAGTIVHIPTYYTTINTATQKYPVLYSVMYLFTHITIHNSCIYV